MPEISRLWPTPEDFFASLDGGIKIIQGELIKEPPCKADEPMLKSLLAVFTTATIEMDPKAFVDPQMQEKLGVVRLALLAAYNLGRQHAKIP